MDYGGLNYEHCQVKLKKYKTSENEQSHGSFFLRVGGIGMKLSVHFCHYSQSSPIFKVDCVRIKSNIQQKVNFLCFLWKYNCKDLFVTERLIMIEEHLDDPDSVLSYI